MSDIGISLASPVKSNNGKFKSLKQAQFLQSKSVQNVVIVGGACYSHSYFTEYRLDDEGVLNIIRLNKGGKKILWERAGSVEVPIQVTKELNRLKRMRKEVSIRIQETQALMDSNEIYKVSCAALQESRIQQMHEIDTRAAQLEADHLI